MSERKLLPVEADFIRECVTRDFLPGWTTRRAGEGVEAAIARRIDRAGRDAVEYGCWCDVAQYADACGKDAAGDDDDARRRRFWGFWGWVLGDVLGGLRRGLGDVREEPRNTPGGPGSSHRDTLAARWKWKELGRYGVDFGGMEKWFPYLLDLGAKLACWTPPPAGEEWPAKNWAREELARVEEVADAWKEFAGGAKSRADLKVVRGTVRAWKKKLKGKGKAARGAEMLDAAHLAGKGFTAAEIAEKLGVSKRTAEERLRAARNAGLLRKRQGGDWSVKAERTKGVDKAEAENARRDPHAGEAAFYDELDDRLGTGGENAGE